MSARFWDRVDRAGDCWVWTGSTNKNGYGWFWWNGKNQRSHRVAWELTHGPIESDVKVLHTCDNPTCVNPDHLYPGTDADNMRDKVERGRQTKGEDVNTAKLTRGDVVELREAYASGISMVVLCERFAVSKSQVCRIVRGQSWKHVGGPVASKAQRRDLDNIRRGESVTGGRLREKDVVEIRRRHGDSESMSALASDHGVSIQTISAIVNRRTWRHV